MNRKSTQIENNVDGDLLAAGSVLAKQREKLGLDKKECAESLKITQSKLTCLEKGDKSAFISELFIRGYIKNYAKLVNISEGEILHVYNAQSQVDSNLVGMVEQRPSKPKWWLPYAMGIVIIIGWFLASDHLSFDQKNAIIVQEKTSLIVEPVTNSELIEVAEPVVLETNEVFEANPLAQEVPIVVENSSSDIPLEPSNQTEGIEEEVILSTDTDSVVAEDLSTSATSEVDAAATNAVNVTVIDTSLSTEIASVVENSFNDSITTSITETESLDSLSFSFTEDCWIEVIDSTGKIIVKSLQIENSSLRLEGHAPFTITFGNVGGASLSFNNSPVVLGQGNENRTLRITVGG